jgi:hypothetical protein
MRLNHPEPFTAAWNARWIWHGRPAIVSETATRPVQADPADRVALFRREFELDAVPASAPARLWVDGRYLLYVNGVEVGRGPVRSDPRAARYDVVDLAGHLRAGTNVIAIMARHFGVATSWWMPVPPSYSLGAGSVVFEARIGDEWLITDRSWRSAPGAAWTPVSIPGDVACLPLESFDATRFAAGWLEPGFDDSQWSKAFEIMPTHTGGHFVPTSPSEPFGMLRPPVRAAFQNGEVHVAELLGSRSVVGAELGDDPVRQVLDDEIAAGAVGSPGDGSGDVELRRFDLGRIAAGTVVLDITGAAAGTVVDFAASEHVSTGGVLVTLGQHAGLRYVCRGDEVEHFESFDIIGTRYLHCSIRAPKGAGSPELTVAVHDRHRPRPAGASFASSDPLLDEIHAVGLRTVDLCALDAYVDCPTREQRAWTGDSVVHQMVDLTNNPDWSMPIWHPQLATMARSDGMLAMAVASDFAADDRTIVPDWSLHWIHSVHNLYRYTGDRAVVSELLSSASRALRWFESYLGPDDLLSDVTGWVLLDWASVYAKGCSSTLNALWARALVEFAEMSRWLGNDGDAEWAMAHHERLRVAFEVFWDERRGVYIDHIVDGVPQRAAAQHPGATALVAELVPDERVARVVEGISDRSRLVRHSFVMDPVRVDGDMSGYVYMVTGYPAPVWDVENEMIEAQPFYLYVIHDAYAKVGRIDLLLESCRTWSQFLDRGETSWPECWIGGTRCHGWSSTPSRDLIQYVLGVQPAVPGFTSVRVAPQLGDLEWIRATVPSPFGPITVEAHADGRVEIDSPVPVVRD